MNTDVQELSPVLVQLKVEIPWDRVHASLEESFEAVSRQARVKGFRPGKVPPKLVRQIYGKQVRGEVAARLIEEGFFTAVQKHALAIVAEPHVDAHDFKDGEPLTFTARVEVRPKIDKVIVEGLEVGHHAHAVSDAEVNEEVENLRLKHSTVRAPEPPRPSKEKDQLTIDYKVELDGVAKPDMGADDRVVDLGTGSLIEAFESGLLGVSAGETKTLEMTFPADHGNEELRGKKATFHVTVKAVRERILPELDDEFAKDVGDYKTLLELRLKVREHLEKVANQHAEAEFKEGLIDALLESNPIEVPPSLVLEEERRGAYEFAAFMNMAGQRPEMTEELHASIHVRAERKVRAALVLAALARQTNIEVTEGDLDARLLQISEQTGKHIAKVKAEYAGERRSMLESNVLEEKLMGYLKSVAKVREETAEQAHKRAEEKRAAALAKAKHDHAHHHGHDHGHDHDHDHGHGGPGHRHG